MRHTPALVENSTTSLIGLNKIVLFLRWRTETTLSQHPLFHLGVFVPTNVILYSGCFSKNFLTTSIQENKFFFLNITNNQSWFFVQGHLDYCCRILFFYFFLLWCRKNSNGNKKWRIIYPNLSPLNAKKICSFSITVLMC